MDLDYTNIDPSNRRYSEEELQEIRERYLSKREAQARGRYGRLTSVLEAALALLAESQRGPWGG